MIDKKIVLEFIIALFGYDFLALINKVSTNDTISFKKAKSPRLIQAGGGWQIKITCFAFAFL